LAPIEEQGVWFLRPVMTKWLITLIKYAQQDAGPQSKNFKFNYRDIHFEIQESIDPQTSDTLQFVEVTFC
jgi:hypothetical protein